MTGDPSIGNLINRAARLLRRAADRRLSPLGLSSGYLPVITALMERGTLSQKELTEQAGIEQPTMAATLARMERDALIERHIDVHDKRSSLVSLTPLARRKTKAVLAAVATVSAEALAGLSDTERQQFRKAVQTVISSLQRELGG